MTTTIPEHTPLGVMLRAYDSGLSMKAQDQKLLVWPDALLSPSMRSELTRWKWPLMYLLAVRFVIAYSETLNRTIFFAEDESAKNALIVAGADSSAIYTLEEIQALAKANLQSVISAKELCVFHEAKQVFNGRITK